MQKLSRLLDSTPFRRGRPQDAAQLEESDGSEAAADADEAIVAADENEFIDSADEFSLDEEEADAAQRKLGLEDPDEAELYGGPDNFPEDEQLSLDESGSDFDGGSGGGGVFGEAIDEAASAAASAAWESRDRQPLLAAAAAAAAAESDTSGDIDLEDGEEDEEDEEGREFAAGRLGGGFSGGFGGGFSGGLGAGFRGGPGGRFSGPGGVFNQGFVDDEIGQMEAAAGWGEDEEQLGGDGGEFDEDGERDQEEEDEEYYEDEDEDFEDDEEDEDEVCFGADAISAGAGTSLTEAQVQRPMPKIVGFLEAEMKHEAKSQSLNVRIVQVELKLALTKFRRKSNKKMRWSMLQVCATLLPDKALTFRTPMVEHEDPKKKKLLTLKAAADSAEAGAAGDKEGEADKGKDGGQNKDKKSGKKDKKKEEGAAKAAPREAAKSGDSAKPAVKIGKLSIPKLAGKSKAKEEAAVGAAAERNSKKSVLAGIAARKAAQQQQQQERREQHRQQQLAMRERQKQERLKQKQAAAAGKPIDEPLQDVTKFAKLETEQEKAAKRADLKQPQEEEDKEIFKFVPISKEKNLEKNPQQPLAIRFRLYGCWRKKRSFLLGENTFALEKMAEAVHTSDKVRQNRFRLQLEERRFAISKLKHLSDSDEELEQQKTSAKAQKKAAKDSVDALLLPPPTEGPALVSQPELFLGLAYNQVNGHLQVAIVKACNLRNPKSDKPPTAYTKVHLMWGLSHNNSVLFRSKTLPISDCPNPEWHETFEYPVSRSHLDDVSVMVKVYCKHTLNRTVTIGWCSIGRNNCSEEALDHWSDMRSSNGEQICNWHVLLKVSKEKTEGQLDSD